MSQQPYPGQPGQPGQPGGYQQPGQGGYPQGGYPGQQPPAGQPFGSYPGGPPVSRPSSGNPLTTPAGLAPILVIVAYVVIALGIIAGIVSFTIDFASGSQKFVQFCEDVISGLGFGGILLALAAFLKTRSS